VFAQLDLAAADDVITFYQAEYAFRIWRPITAIRGGANAATRTPSAIRPGRPNWAPRPTRRIPARTA
jgi:hypothetical protein